MGKRLTALESFHIYWFCAKVKCFRHRGRSLMDRTVADLNIAHFKRLLETETDADKRELLTRLLALEEAKLAASPDTGPPAGKASGG